MSASLSHWIGAVSLAEHSPLPGRQSVAPDSEQDMTK